MRNLITAIRAGSSRPALCLPQGQPGSGGDTAARGAGSLLLEQQFGARSLHVLRQAVRAYAPGHGLWLVRLLADQMNVASGPGGTCATVTFTLR